MTALVSAMTHTTTMRLHHSKGHYCILSRYETPNGNRNECETHTKSPTRPLLQRFEDVHFSPSSVEYLSALNRHSLIIRTSRRKRHSLDAIADATRASGQRLKLRRHPPKCDGTNPVRHRADAAPSPGALRRAEPHGLPACPSHTQTLQTPGCGHPEWSRCRRVNAPN